MKGQKSHQSRPRGKLTSEERRAVRRVRSLIHSASDERGGFAEDAVEEVLKFLAGEGLLKFRRTPPNTPVVDFEIWGLNPFKAHFTIDVKSSEHNAERVRKKEIPNHHPLVVVPGQTRSEVAENFLEIFEAEAEVIEPRL